MMRASKIIVTLLTHQLLLVKIGEYRWYYVTFKKISPPLENFLATPLTIMEQRRVSIPWA